MGGPGRVTGIQGRVGARTARFIGVRGTRGRAGRIAAVQAGQRNQRRRGVAGGRGTNLPAVQRLRNQPAAVQRRARRFARRGAR